MFQEEDLVVYGGHGMCKVTEIRKESFYGKNKTFYVLHPLKNDETIYYVPVEGPAAEKLHRVLSQEEISGLIQSIPDLETIWIENDTERKQAYRKILRSGDRVSLVKLIKTLYQRQQERIAAGKHILQSDADMLKEAQDLLHGELMQVLHLDQEQVLPYIQGQIGSQADKGA